jgi:beta-glucanase (GH16 family)
VDAGWGNEELQYYTGEPENVRVRDSCLFIRAVKAPLHGCGYTSARLKTKARDGTVLFAKLYGRVEFRARVPWGKGCGRRCGCCRSTTSTAAGPPAAKST